MNGNINSAINNFFSDVPAIICVRSSYIAAANEKAAARLQHRAEGERLFDRMKAFDVLRFQAAYDGRRDSELLIFELKELYGFHVGAASFCRIMSRRFAVVWMFTSYEELEALKNSLTDYGAPFDAHRIGDFLSVLSSAPSELTDEKDRSGMLDLRASARRCIDDILSAAPALDCKISISENTAMRECACCPLSVPMMCFVQMVASALVCINDISTTRLAQVRLCMYSGEAEMHFVTDCSGLGAGVRDFDSLMEALPSSALYLSVCDHAAGSCFCDFSVRRDDDRKNISLVFTFAENSLDKVDFKSRDSFAYYDEALEFTVKNMFPTDTILHTEEASKAE